MPASAPQRDQGAAAGQRRTRAGQSRLAHVAHLHRSPDLRLGDRDHHHADGHRRDRLAAGRAISRRRADRRSTSARPIRAPRPQTLESSVTQILEQQLTGIDGLLYFQSSSTLARPGHRSASIFEKGIDPDIAQVQVQNAIQAAISRLPQQVQQQGVRVTKGSPDFLLIVGIYDETDRSTNFDVSDWLTTQHAGRAVAHSRASATSTSSARPTRCASGSIRTSCASFQLMPSDVITAIQNQNTEVAAGEIGGTAAAAKGRCSTRPSPRSRGCRRPSSSATSSSRRIRRGARVLLGDVARVELGADNYAAIDPRRTAIPAPASASSSSPARTRCARPTWSRRRSSEIAPRMPRGYQLRLRQRHDRLHQAVDPGGREDAVRGDPARRPRHVRLPAELAGDADPVHRRSGRAARHLRDPLRARLLDQHDDPVRAGAGDRPAGRRRDRRRRECRAADGRKSGDDVRAKRRSCRWSQIQMALVAIALVLSAVFLPMVFFGGSTGVIYRQFSATIVSAMALSVFIALTLSPAIAANLLRRTHATVEETWLGRTAPARRALRSKRAGSGSTPASTGCVDWYVGHVSRVVDRKWLFLGDLRAASASLLAILFFRLPTGFLPTEDQGAALIQFRLPAGATMDRTREVQLAVEDYFLRGPGEEERQDLLHRRRRRPGRGRPEYRARRSSTSPITTSGTARRTAPTRSSSAPRAHSAACATRRSSRWSRARSAVSASRAASPWSCRTPAA